MSIQQGFKKIDQDQAAYLYASAFKRKFVNLIGDEDPKAQSLYYRLGFRKTAYSKIPKPFAGLLGVTGVTHMKKTLN